MIKRFCDLLRWVIRDKLRILALSIFILHLFLRFYQLEERMSFGWDQLENAWVSKNIIIDHKFPLLGMVAKANSGIYIGPLYYYLISFFYWIFNMDPLASGVFAGITAIFTFFTIFYITKKLFSFNIALISIFIYTSSLYMINFDRMQWPVNFIPSVSLIIFYALYNILIGKYKYLVLLAITLGFSFQIHFTSIFYLIIIFLSIPFLFKNLNKKLSKYLIISVPLFLIWFIPSIVAEVINKSNPNGNLLNYLNTYYHGIHLKRILQMAKDAFIEFEGFVAYPFAIFKPIKYLLAPLFLFTYYFRKPSKERLIFCYLIILWFVVPWISFSAYSGEISNYYFSLTIPIVILVLSYLLWRLISIKNVIVNTIIVLILAYYAIVNIQAFLNQTEELNLKTRKAVVIKAIKESRLIQFSQNNLDSYLYYLYTRNSK